MQTRVCSGYVYYEIYIKCIKLHILWLLFYRSVYTSTKSIHVHTVYTLYTVHTWSKVSTRNIEKKTKNAITTATATTKININSDTENSNIIIYITAILLLSKRIAPSENVYTYYNLFNNNKKYNNNNKSA